MSLDKFVEMYMDWRNNFLSVEAFASHYNIDRTTAEMIISAGRIIERVQL